MNPRFREEKATQAACALLARAGGHMPYMKLIKLLYLADRDALLSWGRPITWDTYVSMKHGPVLSRVLDRINEGDPPEEKSAWHRHIRRRGRYAVEMKHDCPGDQLSEAEESLLHRVFDNFGTMDRWTLVDHLHRALREWQDPGGSALPIAYRDILRAEGRTDLEIAEIESELDELALTDYLLPQ